MPYMPGSLFTHMAAGDGEVLVVAKAKKRAHDLRNMRERNIYYHRRCEARSPVGNSISLIFDKWNSRTTTVPFFTRHPGAWWQKLVQRVLCLHVMLVLIHGIPDMNYFFYSDHRIIGVPPRPVPYRSTCTCMMYYVACACATDFDACVRLVYR